LSGRLDHVQPRDETYEYHMGYHEIQNSESKKAPGSFLCVVRWHRRGGRAILDQQRIMARFGLVREGSTMESRVEDLEDACLDRFTT